MDFAAPLVGADSAGCDEAVPETGATCITRILDRGITSIIDCWLSTATLLFPWLDGVVGDDGVGSSGGRDAITDDVSGSGGEVAFLFIAGGSSGVAASLTCAGGTGGDGAGPETEAT